MRPVWMVLACLGLSFSVWAQTSLPLNFSSYAISLGVAADNSVSIVNRVGQVGVAASVNGQWRRADVGSGEIISGALLDQTNFFNKDTGFVSGYVNDSKHNYDIIYRTTDAGHTWKQVRFGMDGWVDDAINLDNGEAWMSVSGKGIAYTRDYGATWQKLNTPQPKERFASIYFNESREGLVGSLWNVLGYTPDNSATWQLLPTPLDQKKYNKTNRQSRPEFKRVAILGNLFLAVQEDLVFYTRRDSINWVCLPAYVDFYTDPANSALFFKTGRGEYVKADSSFAVLHRFNIDEEAYDVQCRNGSLFIVAGRQMLQFTTSHELIKRPFSRADVVPAEPIAIGYTERGTIALQNKTILQKSWNADKWQTLGQLPAAVDSGSVSVIENAMLLYERGDDSLFYYSLNGKLVKAATLTDQLKEFAHSRISRLIFSQGSRGCFHNYADQLVFTNLGDSFGGDMEFSHDTKSTTGMHGNDQRIRTSTVDSFVKATLYLFDNDSQATIDELRFTPQDYERCRQDIRAFQSSLQQSGKKKKETAFSFPRNNLDFDRLLSLVDSVKTIEPTLLWSLLIKINNAMWSTTTNWKKIELVNDKNEKLTLTSEYFIPNAFYSPWVITLNGITVTSPGMPIIRFLEKTYPAFLENLDKVQVLHYLVKQLY